MEKIEHGKPGLKESCDSLNKKEIPNNASYSNIHIVIAEKANKPLQNKRYHCHITIVHFLGNQFYFSIALRVSDAQHLIKNSHVGHYKIHIVIIFAG